MKIDFVEINFRKIGKIGISDISNLKFRFSGSGKSEFPIF